MKEENSPSSSYGLSQTAASSIFRPHKQPDQNSSALPSQTVHSLHIPPYCSNEYLFAQKSQNQVRSDPGECRLSSERFFLSKHLMFSTMTAGWNGFYFLIWDFHLALALKSRPLLCSSSRVASLPSAQSAEDVKRRKSTRRHAEPDLTRLLKQQVVISPLHKTQSTTKYDFICE